MIKATMYKIIDYNGKFAVQNTNDEVIMKSKESGNVISFPTIEGAENLKKILDHNVNMIIDASKYWFIKEKVGPNTFIMKKIEL